MEDKLHEARKRWRWLNALVGLCLTFSIFCVVTLLSFYSDRFFILSNGMRLGWLIAFIGVILFGIVFLSIIPALRKIPDEKVAEAVERRYPILKERLLTSIELAHAGATSGASNALIAQLRTDTASIVEPLNFKSAISYRPLRRPATFACILGVILLGYIAFEPQAMDVWFNRIIHPFADIPVYASTQVWVMPGDIVLPRGDDVQLGVKVGGNLTDVSMLYYRFGNGNWSSVRLNKPEGIQQAGRGYHIFSYKLQDVQQDVSYYATANDGHANPMTIRVVDRPTILGMKMTVNYPSYMHKDPLTYTASSGNIVAPVGSNVTVRAVANKPVSNAVFLVNGLKKGNWAVHKNVISGQLSVMHDENYSLQLTDQYGFRELTPPTYTVRAQPDMPPTVQIVIPAQDVERTPNGFVNLKVTASDDYGVNSLGLHWKVGHRSSSMPLPGANGSRFAGMTGPWQLAPLDLKGGETVTYYAYAMDNDTVTGPNMGKSAVYHVKIISESEMRMRVNAEMQEQQDAINQLIKHQELAQSELSKAMKNLNQTAGLNQAQAEQRSVAQEAASLASQIQQTTTEMQNNNIGLQSEINRRITAASLLNQLSQQAMPHAADTIQQAVQNPSGRAGNASNAAQQESRIHSQLMSIASNVSRAPDLGKLAQQAQNLANEQHLLADTSNLEHAKIGEKSPSEMTPQERASLNYLATRQQNLRNQTEDLLNGVKEAARDAAERGRANAQMLQQTLREASQANMPSNQNEAQRNLQNGNPVNAALKQNQVANDLQNLADNLDQSNTGVKREDLAHRANQLDRIANKLQEMAQKEMNLANQSAGNPDENTSRNLAQEQSQMQRSANFIAQQLSDVPPAQQGVRSASQNMQQAESELNKPAPQNATQPANEASRQLNQAAQALHNSANSLRQEQNALQLQNQVSKIAQAQRSIENSTKNLHNEIGSRQLTPQQANQVQAIAQNQSKLNQMAQSLNNKMPSPAFQWMMQNQVENKMENALEGLQAHNIGEETQRQQRNAADTLDRVARALGQEANGAQQRAESGDEGSERNDQTAQSLGDLTLAREMEQQIHEETASLDRRRAGNPNNSLSSGQQRELNQLNNAQNEDQQITRDAANHLTGMTGVSEKVNKAADEMRDVQSKLGNQETGTPTQNQQKEIVSMLDQAINQVQQAMRNNRQQMMASAISAQQRQTNAPQQNQNHGHLPAMKSLPRLETARTGAFANVKQGGKGFVGLGPRSIAAMREGRNERVPAEYRQLVNEYYKALSENAR